MEKIIECNVECVDKEMEELTGKSPTTLFPLLFKLSDLWAVRALTIDKSDEIDYDVSLVYIKDSSFCIDIPFLEMVKIFKNQ